MSDSTPTRRRPTRAKKSEANRERILLAARDVFGARGYHGATIEEIADEEARDITRSFKESREWRLLLLEFVAYAALNPTFAERFKDHSRRLRAAVADILELHLSARGITPPMPIDQLAMSVTGVANGLAVEELSDPGSVSDELLGDVLALLVSQRAPAPGPLRRWPLSPRRVGGSDD